MKKVLGNQFTGTMFVGLVVALIASPVMAYPPDPDNAALLYYQGFLTLAQLSEDSRDRIAAVAKGEIAPDENVRQDIGKCIGAIEFTEAAAQVPVCHWGVRFSQGFDAVMPQMAQSRFLTFVLIADARIRAADGDYRGALERCLMTGTFARHIGDDTLISYLVSIAVRGLEYRCMQDIMGQAASDAKLLQWLKNELATAGDVIVSPIRPMKIEIQIVLNVLQMENAQQYARVVSSGSDDKTQEEILATVNEEIFERARQLYLERANSALTVLSTPMPYDQAHMQLKELMDGFDPNDPSSAAAGALAPSLASVLTVKTRGQTHANAIKVAIEVLLSHARTGRLPNALPVGLPKDAFSGKDFEYDKTKDGFVLRCRAKDLTRDEIHQYEFKVAK